MLVLHLKSFGNNHLTSGYFKVHFVWSKPLRKVKRLQNYKIFFQGSCSFSYIKTLLKVLDPVSEQNSKPDDNL